MERIARVIVSHNKPILAATALISLVAVAMLFRLQFNADISSFALTGSEAGEAFVELQEKYNTGDPINAVVTLPEGETFRSKAGLVTLVELRDEILSVEGVESVATIVPDENPITGEPLTAVAVGSAPEQLVVALVDSSPVSQILLDESGRNTLMLIIPADDATALARTLAEMEPPNGVEVTLSGNPVIFATVLDIFSWFLLVIPPLVIALLVGVFYLAFHNSYTRTEVVEVVTEVPLFGGMTQKQVKKVLQPVLGQDRDLRGTLRRVTPLQGHDAAVEDHRGADGARIGPVGVGDRRQVGGLLDVGGARRGIRGAAVIGHRQLESQGV